MMLAALTSLGICIFLGPRFISKLYEMKIGQSIRKEECPTLWQLHEKKENTPTMGGILILFSMVVSLFLWMDLSHSFTAILLATTLFFGGIGAWDDYLKLKKKNAKGLSAKKKFSLQCLFGLVLALYLLFPTVSESFRVGSWFHPPVVKEHVAKKGKAHELVTVKQQEYAGRLYVPFFQETPFDVFRSFSCRRGPFYHRGGCGLFECSEFNRWIGWSSCRLPCDGRLFSCIGSFCF